MVKRITTVPFLDSKPLGYAGVSSQLFLRNCHDRDCHWKEDGRLISELGFSRKEVHRHDEKSEKQQAITIALIADNMKLADERMEEDLTGKKEVKELHGVMNWLKEVKPEVTR